MIVKEIPYTQWHRHAHAEFIGRAALPFLQVQHTLDVTHFRAVVKARGTSFYFALIWASMQVIAAREDFRWRLRGDRAVLLDELEPSFTDMMEGTELYKVVNAGPAGDDMVEYARRARATSDAQQYFFPTDEEERGDGFVYFSSLPLTTLSVLCQAMDTNKDNFIPGLAWSRYYEQDGRTLLLYTMLCNHRQVDGLHVARFFIELQQFIDGLV